MTSPDIGIRIDIIISFTLSLGKESPCGKLNLSDKGLIISSSLMVGPVGKKKKKKIHFHVCQEYEKENDI